MNSYIDFFLNGVGFISGMSFRLFCLLTSLSKFSCYVIIVSSGCNEISDFPLKRHHVEDGEF